MFELKFDGEYAAIPVRMRAAIERYCVARIKPGSFLTAILTNDLEGAVFNADQENLPLIKLYVQWFKMHTSGLTGKENFIKWLSEKPAIV